MKLDYFNALFEFGGSVFMMLNVIKLYQDKVLRGVRILPAIFFSLWGLWNLCYYPSLNQWWSFTAGLLVTVVNIAWVIMAVYYTKRKIKDDSFNMRK